MRIAKYIANAGICSRRDAEKLIEKKEVKVNGILCTHPSLKITEKDKVYVFGKILKSNDKLRIWKLYKPVKYICTNKDPKKRKTIYDLVPKNYPRVISIGRLDFMSEGLILLTNKGDFARKLELPSSNFERIYRVCIRGKVEKESIKKINSGIVVNKVHYNKIKISIEKFSKPYSWLVIKLKEGKNREIRNIFDYFSWKIVKLIRIQYGPYKLSNLKKGEISEIKISK
tara:strand:- start:19 stop:702 length:684 start_codon:yes stop_codon:yes gene_type:complete